MRSDHPVKCELANEEFQVFHVTPLRKMALGGLLTATAFIMAGLLQVMEPLSRRWCAKIYFDNYHSNGKCFEWEKEATLCLVHKWFLRDLQLLMLDLLEKAYVVVWSEILRCSLHSQPTKNELPFLPVSICNLPKLVVASCVYLKSTDSTVQLS